MPGTWSVAADFSKYKTLKQGFEDALKGKAELLYAKNQTYMPTPELEKAVTLFGREMRDPRSGTNFLPKLSKVAAEADVIVAALGEASESSGESSSKNRPHTPRHPAPST